MDSEVAVVVGAGGMGLAIAGRIGGGRRLLIADHAEGTLESASAALHGNGHVVTARRADVGDPGSVQALVETAAGLGAVTRIVHTAGLSVVQAAPAEILRVDLLGVALVLDGFGRVVAPGGAGVVVGSMAAHMVPAPRPDQEHALATAPVAELLDLPFLDPDRLGPMAYGLAKRGNTLRVRAAASSWGRRSARVNCISPGVVATPMGRQELDGPSGGSMRAMIDGSGTGRIGTTDDIADAAAFLLGPESSWITGADLLVDGGVVASLVHRPPAG